MRVCEHAHTHICVYKDKNWDAMNMKTLILAFYSASLQTVSLSPGIWFSTFSGHNSRALNITARRHDNVFLQWQNTLGCNLYPKWLWLYEKDILEDFAILLFCLFCFNWINFQWFIQYVFKNGYFPHQINLAEWKSDLLKDEFIQYLYREW